MADLKLDQLDPFLPPMQDNDLFLVKMKRRTSMIGDEDRGITWAQLKTEINLDRYMLNTGGNFTGNVAFNYNVGVQGKTAGNATRNVAKIGSLPTSPAQPSTVLIGDPTLNLAVQSAGVPQYWDGSNAFSFITEKNLPAPSDLSAGGAYTKAESDTALNTKFDKVGGDIAGDTILANGRSLRSRTSTNTIVTLTGLTTGNLLLVGNQTTPVQIQSSVIPQAKVGAGAASNIWGDFNKPLPSALGNGGTTGAYTKDEVGGILQDYLKLSTGGVILGKTRFNNQVQMTCMTGATATTPNVEATVFYSGTNALALGDVKQATLINGDGNLKFKNAAGTADVYTTLNKPTSNDIVRSAGTASGITASLNLADSALQKGAYGLGAKAVNIPSTVTSLSDDTITVMTGWWTAAGTYTDAPVDLSSSGQPVGIIFSVRRAFEAGCALVQTLYVAGGVQYIRTAPAPVSGVWNWHGTSQGADANGWRRVYDQAVKPTTTELNVYTKGEADGRFANLGSDGSNLDITALNGLTGALKVGANATDPLHVTTLQQVQAMTSGTAGAVVGVVGGFIGAVQWFNGSRATIPAGWAAADGQLLSRADYPDLWAAINSKALGTATEAQWQATFSNNGVAEATGRGNYSTGTVLSGASANFRMPDLNGCQPNSVAGVFLRGDAFGKGATADHIGSAGSTRLSRAPNITGSIAMHGAGTTTGTPLGGANGALKGVGAISKWSNLASLAADSATSYGQADFNAGTSGGAGADVYNRINSDNTPAAEVAPNYASGIWIIRVSNNFDAANTSFAIYNGSATMPANGAAMNGGALYTRYDVASVTQALGSVQILKTAGATSSNLTFTAFSKGASSAADQTSTMNFSSAGLLSTPSLSVGTNINTATLGVTGNATINGEATFAKSVVASASVRGDSLRASGGTLQLWGSNDPASTQGYISFGNAAGTQYSSIYSERAGDLTISNNGQGTIRYFTFTKDGNASAQGTWINGSDGRHKFDLIVVPNALEAVRSWRGVTYQKKDSAVREVGLIAQDVEKDCPEAVYTSRREFSDGTVIEDFKSLNTAGAAAAYRTEAIKQLADMVEALQARITELEAK